MARYFKIALRGAAVAKTNVTEWPIIPSLSIKKTKLPAIFILGPFAQLSSTFQQDLHPTNNRTQLRSRLPPRSGHLINLLPGEPQLQPHILSPPPIQANMSTYADKPGKPLNECAFPHAPSPHSNISQLPRNQIRNPQANPKPDSSPQP